MRPNRFNLQIDSDVNEPGRELYDSAVRGNHAAVETLLIKFLPELHAFIALRCGRRLLEMESADDLVQSVCKEVLKDAGNIRYQSEAHFKHWLYTAALNKIAHRYAYYRAEKRDIERVANVRESPDASRSHAEAGLLGVYKSICTPSQQAIARETLQQLEEAFATLTEEQKEVVLLARVIGLTHAEIAEKLGKNEASTRALLYRALAKLAGRLSS
ncbi:MAG: RNA polymerase sigma factor [Planctomycetes bacterium]|nr:RNA polymerase sigma factor [Planctomycetota bacterium]